MLDVILKIWIWNIKRRRLKDIKYLVRTNKADRQWSFCSKSKPQPRPFANQASHLSWLHQDAQLPPFHHGLIKGQLHCLQDFPHHLLSVCALHLACQPMASGSSHSDFAECRGNSWWRPRLELWDVHQASGRCTTVDIHNVESWSENRSRDEKTRTQ